MKLYGSYTNNIRNAIHAVSNLRSMDNFSGNPNTSMKALMTESAALEPKTGLETLAKLLGIQEVRKPVLGDHPDFKQLRVTGGFEYHYITSMFVDVKGSTNFHKKYSLEQIAVIIQTIVTAATHTCALFGGSIQRLQYDGVFCYFGGKSISKSESVKAALNAATFFSYFIKFELKEIFELEGIDNVYTRIGIDFGDDKEVQWLIFGTGDCTELTTNSLHTSLAPKMQSYAPTNGVMIGDNVKKRLDSLEVYCDLLRNKEGNIEETSRYIYKDEGRGFNYTQWNFNWLAYLNTFSFITTSSDGKVFIDYNGKSNAAEEKRRVQSLYETSKVIAARQAYITPEKTISHKPTQVKAPDHNFYYDPLQ